jgi:Rad3-related DNA helicase
MMNNMNHPSYYQVHNHESWRPGQLDAIQKIIRTRKQIVIASAPTGSGKTSIGAALGSRGSAVRALTHTRALQRQYSEYDFEVLHGMAAYPCALNSIFNASLCAHSQKMTNCPMASSCEYLTQREVTKKHHRQALSYAYYLLAGWPKSNMVEYLYQDEAHLLPDLVREHMKIHITPKICKLLKLDVYPLAEMSSQTARRVRLTKWLSYALEKTSDELEYLEGISDKSEYQLREMLYLKKFVRPLYMSLSASYDMPDHFWFKADKDSLEVTPLTAVPFYRNLFVPDETKAVLTSATIGNPVTFAGALGLSRDDYLWIDTPSNFSSDQMPVYVYKDSPKMGYKTTPAGKRKQIDIIAKIIKERDPKKNALIHTSSIRDAKFIAEHLFSQFGDRIYLPDENTSTTRKVHDWRTRISKKPGTITLAWSFHAGLNAPEVDINIIQKVPFAPLNETGKALMGLNPKLYAWNAANKVEQAAGRIRRGDPEHYEFPMLGERKHVAIVDMNFNRVKKQTSNHFQRCVNYV